MIVKNRRKRKLINRSNFDSVYVVFLYVHREEFRFVKIEFIKKITSIEAKLNLT